MKVTKTQLRQIIAEELKKTLEGLSRKRGYTLVDLFEFTNLYQSGEKSVKVTGMDVSSGTKIPVTMTLSMSPKRYSADREAQSLVNTGKGVPVPDELLGTPFYITNLGQEYVFILSQ
tara:strand:- start:395 stop:745 length:351 start_codon:yes stop_codon:yes gene_type:complete